MKKILYTFLLSTIFIPATFGMCAVEDTATVCTVPQFREKLAPIYNTQSGVSEFSDTPEVRLSPADRSDVHAQIREFAPAGSDNSYNSSCQFGVCLQNRSTPLFQQPKQ